MTVPLKKPVLRNLRIFSVNAVFASSKSHLDFNYDLVKVSENKLLHYFPDHVQRVNKLTHIFASLTDHVYIKKTFMEKVSTNSTAIRIAIEKNAVEF